MAWTKMIEMHQFFSKILTVFYLIKQKILVKFHKSCKHCLNDNLLSFHRFSEYFITFLNSIFFCCILVTLNFGNFVLLNIKRSIIQLPSTYLILIRSFIQKVNEMTFYLLQTVTAGSTFTMSSSMEHFYASFMASVVLKK